MTKQKQCPECKKLYEPKRDVQVYCGLACVKAKTRRKNAKYFNQD